MLCDAVGHLTRMTNKAGIWLELRNVADFL